MVSFEKPKFSFPFALSKEIQHLRDHKAHREVPEKSDRDLLLCTWNIANLGLHERGPDHYDLMAEILNWFDIIAIQEVNDDLSGLFELQNRIGSTYQLIFNDRGGNDERAAFFYDNSKIERLAMTGELAIAPASKRYIRIKGVDSEFKGFDRNPFIASFQFRNTRFMLVNAHLFFGGTSKKDMERRALEAYATGRYADLRHDDKHVFADNIIALGDFNIPKAEKGDPIYDALVKRGLTLPEHSTQMGSSISSDSHYDQIAFFPGLKRKIQANGVFDYDTKIFPDLWDQGERDFKSYCRYYISDHRPMWIQIRLD